MKPTKITVRDEAREFQINELFFSTTDRTGIIRSGNHVFARVSGYAEETMRGRPHNLIRHPDMPRAIFRLIWEELRQNRAVAGYVKNLASDGRHYWVVAVITPLDEGYLSVRFKPADRLHGQVMQLYAEMRLLEQNAEKRGELPAEGMNRAQARLNDFIREAGFSNYGAFMSSMVRNELHSRDAAISAAGLELIPRELTAAENREGIRLRDIHAACLKAYRELGVLYAGLDHYLELELELKKRLSEVTTLSDGIRLVALNAKIKATQLGEEGHCTGVVADFLGQTSSEVSALCTSFDRQLDPVAEGLQSVVFNLAAARLQLEMILLFNGELTRAGRLDRTHGYNLDVLQSAFGGTIDPAVQALLKVERALHGYRGHSEEFAKVALNLRVAQTTGAIEASRLTEDVGLVQTFHDLRRQNESCRSETDRLEDLLGRFDALAASSPAIITQITSAIQTTRRSVKELVSLLDRETDPKPAVHAQPFRADKMLAVVS